MPELFESRWSAALVYECGLGATRFEQLRQSLGISRRILAERLITLVEQGVMERRQYQVRPPRYEYRLTTKGLALLPTLREIVRWGAEWE